MEYLLLLLAGGSLLLPFVNPPKWLVIALGVFLVFLGLLGGAWQYFRL